MALVYPVNTGENKFLNSQAERDLYNLCRNHLPSSFVCYFNYLIKGLEFDTAILIPGKGIVVIENKGWKPEYIEQVIDNNVVEMKDHTTEKSPYKQARGYSFALLNEIREKFNLNIKIFPAVCYPYISQNEFRQTNLNLLSTESVTFLLEEIESPELFLQKLINLLDLINPANCKIFDEDAFKKVRSLYEPTELIEAHQADLNKAAELIIDDDYSLLFCLPGTLPEEEQEQIAVELANKWSRGAKIIVASDSRKLIELLKAEVIRKAASLMIDYQFNFTDKAGVSPDFMFNFEIYELDQAVCEYFVIQNGELASVELYREKLNLIDQYSNFNLGQYLIEHAPRSSDILVKAGAGTGKTHTMVSRLSYLIYIEKLSAKAFLESIVLVTFTNEATKAVKDRLSNYFQNMYLLTRRPLYLDIIEQIDSLRISTLHALARRIVELYSSPLGLGRDFSITSGKHERKVILDQVIDNYLNEVEKDNPDIRYQMKISMYQLKKRLIELQKKLEDRNLDILYDNLDWGYDNNHPLPQLHKLIEHVLPIVEKQLRLQLEAENRLRMNDLMLKLKEILRSNLIDTQLLPIKYVFVDEFQDTDNVQIDLIKKFREIFRFNLFVVGDVKQCIYRFRGAEHKAFDRLMDGTTGWLPSFELRKNYRTYDRLLDRFADSFAFWGKEELLDYSEESNRLIGIRRYNHDPDKGVFRQIICDDNDLEEQIINEIGFLKNQLSPGHTLAILVRENKEVDAIRRLGEKHNIYIKTFGGGDLFGIIPTLDLYKLVLALKNPYSPKFLFNLYYSCYVDKSIRISQIYERQGSREELCDYFLEEKVIPEWDKYIKKLKLKPVLKVLRDIIKARQPWKVYGQQGMFDEEVKDRERYYKRNLDQIFENLAMLGKSDYLSINSIEEYLRLMIMTRQQAETRETLSLEINPNQVNIVCATIHKVKGLEYEAVFMPYTNRRIDDEFKKGYSEAIVIEQDNLLKIGYRIVLEEKLDPPYKDKILKNRTYINENQRENESRRKEETRLLYVAMTRAKEIFSYIRLVEESKGLTWSKLIEKGEK